MPQLNAIQFYSLLGGATIFIYLAYVGFALTLVGGCAVTN